jgi:hypothetical protein
MKYNEFTLESLDNLEISLEEIKWNEALDGISVSLSVKDFPGQFFICDIGADVLKEKFFGDVLYKFPNEDLRTNKDFVLKVMNKLFDLGAEFRADLKKKIFPSLSKILKNKEELLNGIGG